MNRLRVFVLANEDVTSNVVFAPLFEADAVEVVGLAFSSTLLAKTSSGPIRQALALLRRTSFRYWLYQVYVNGLFKARERLALRPGWPPVLRRLAARSGVAVTTSGDFNATEFVDRVRRAEPDLLVIRVNQILGRELLEVPRRGTWCVHSSILPGYRGIAGELHALRRGETSVGSTLFSVVLELDAGPSLVQRRVLVHPGDSVFAATIANNRAAAILLREAVEELARNDAVERALDPQPPPPSYFGWPSASDMTELRGRGRRLMTLREAVGYLGSVMGWERRRGE